MRISGRLDDGRDMLACKTREALELSHPIVDRSEPHQVSQHVCQAESIRAYWPTCHRPRRLIESANLALLLIGNC